MLPKKACVIGYPISHSLSPVIHNYWLRKYNIEGEYTAIEVKPEELKNFILNLDKSGFRGCNITIPHKEKAFEIVKKLNQNIQSSGHQDIQSLPQQVAHFMGAINTIVIDENKNLVATNTDFLGFARNLIEHAPEFDYDKSTALILGAGGAGKAVAFALASMQVPALVITNRTREKAEEIRSIMVKNFNFPEDHIEVVDWEMREDVLPHCNIVVNATSLGMKNVNGNYIDLQKLPPNSLVTDIVYNPLETEILKQSKQLGHITVDGLGMLLHQAAPGFEGWFGKKPLVDKELRGEVLKKLL